jgi:excinuclease UvrABC nuclease subunit
VLSLANAEINLNEALRNSYADKAINSEFYCLKKLFYRGGKLISDLFNASEPYILVSEKMLIRYYLLRNFVSQIKTDKLKFLSDIIGFSEVTKTKEILRKVFTSIKSETKTQSFENQVEVKKKILL